MLELLLGSPQHRALRVLCIGAHCDDIEIGCGATLIELQQAGRVSGIDWVILSGTDERKAETRNAMASLISAEARGELLFGDFTDGYLPGEYTALKRYFETLKELPRPDVIFTHERDDRHQDHRTCNEMVWNTFRDHLVLEFEIPKWDGGLGQPTCYVPVSECAAERKIAALVDCYATQRSRDWFHRDTFVAIMRLRGLECRSPSGLAEAFHGRKFAINMSASHDRS